MYKQIQNVLFKQRVDPSSNSVGNVNLNPKFANGLAIRVR